MSAMKGLTDLRSAAGPRQVVPLVYPVQRSANASQNVRRVLTISALPKQDLTSGKRSNETTTVVPSIQRRMTLLGAAVPCICGLCSSAAKATGRNSLYDRYFATAMRYGMDDYEAAIRPIKTDLFERLISGLLVRDATENSSECNTGEVRQVLEVGIGTGPNFPFYTAALAAIAEQPTAAGAISSVSPSLSESKSESGCALKPMVAAMKAQERPWPGLHVVGLDPNAAMLRYAAEAATAMGLEVTSAVDESSATVNAIGTSVSSSSSGGRDGRSGSASAIELSLVQGDVDALPFGDGQFDAAVVTLVMCSVASPRKALEELRRVVRPGGRLLLIEHVAAGEGRPGLRLAQSVLTPLQRLLADGCCLNRDTAAAVRGAGWRGELHSFDLEGFSILAPHIAGVLVA